MKIAIATLGCKVNQFESAAISDMMQSLGHKLVSFNEKAELYIVNSCTVTGKTDFQSRQLVRRANRANPDAVIIVTGCGAQASPEHFSGLSGVRLVTGNAEKEDLPALISRITDLSRESGGPGQERAGVLVGDIRQQERISGLSPSSFPGRTRAFVRIQDGCDSSCSYCIIPSVRGRSRSLPMEEVLKQIERLASSGHQEVVLTGIHLGRYGSDLSPALSLTALLGELEERSPVRRVRLSSIEPREATPELIEFLKCSKIVCPHLHIPLQSGDDAVLSSMNRDYSSGYYRELALRLCASLPGLALGTDVMAGFPGESEDNFANTAEFIKALPFAYLHVFPYSDRPGTAAATMKGKIRADVKNRRAALLRDLGREKREMFAGRFTGRELSVLVEGARDRETGHLKGFSENYIPVLVCNAGVGHVNRVVAVRAESACGGKITARVANGN